MKAGRIALYVSIAFNVALLVLVAWPRTTDTVALGQTAAMSGNYATISSRGGGNQDALWIADRVSGVILVYQYELGSNANPVRLMGSRDLRADLQERQIGNLILNQTGVSTTTSVIFAIDTDSGRSAVYEYVRSDKRINLIQQIDMRAVMAAPVTAAPVEDTSRGRGGRR